MWPWSPGASGSLTPPSFSFGGRNAWALFPLILSPSLPEAENRMRDPVLFWLHKARLRLSLEGLWRAAQRCGRRPPHRSLPVPATDPMRLPRSGPASGIKEDFPTEVQFLCFPNTLRDLQRNPTFFFFFF